MCFIWKSKKTYSLSWSQKDFIICILLKLLLLYLLCINLVNEFRTWCEVGLSFIFPNRNTVVFLLIYWVLCPFPHNLKHSSNIYKNSRSIVVHRSILQFPLLSHWSVSLSQHQYYTVLITWFYNKLWYLVQQVFLPFILL